MANRGEPPVPLHSFRVHTVALLAVLSVAGILIHGYHYGFDDQSVYLPAIKKTLDPGLYPLDAGFFLSQARLGCFVDAIAASVRITHLSVDWALLCWHFVSVFLLLAGCWRIARRFFPSPAGVLGSLSVITALLTLPVAGTFVVLCEPYLHTRALATAFLLFAFADIMEKRLMAVAWIALAGLTHPTIAMFGVWHIVVQAWPEKSRRAWGISSTPSPAVALSLAPVALLAKWFADPADPAWRSALSGRRYLFPAQWTWYELLGAFAPLVILYLFAQLGRSRGLDLLSRTCRRLAVSGSIGVAAGITIGITPALLPLVPLEPMRTLHLIYLFMVLVAGGLWSELMPRAWKLAGAALVVLLAFGMFLAQRVELDSSPHIEWPGTTPRNDWQESFAWIRGHTPRDALFAMNPEFLHLPGENEHGFRGLAERSQLAESAKDRAVSRNLPALAWQWRDEVRAQSGIEDFDLARLTELRRRYRVTWLLLRKGAGRAAGLPALECPSENATLRVCRCP